MIVKAKRDVTSMGHVLRLGVASATIAGVLLLGLANNAGAATCASGTGSCPGAPTSVTASVTSSPSGSALVTWAAPIDTGSGITGYAITALQGTTPVSTTTVGVQLSATLSGLTNGTSYTFKVAAAIATGYGTASVASNAVTPATVPGPPISVSASSGNASATVGWSAPISNGGASISSYTVTASPGGSSATVSGSTLSATVSGLTNGTSYTFSVIATNSQGSGTASDPSSSVTPSSGTATVPDAPPTPTGTGGPSQVTLNWSAPASNGGAAITSYTVQTFQGGTLVSTLSVTAPSTSVVVAGLTNGLSYTFDVAALNSIGTGNASPLSQAIAVAQIPVISITSTPPALSPIALAFASAPSGVSVGEAAGTHSVNAGASPNVGTVVYGSATPSVCTVNATSGALTIVASGTCTIDADDSGAANYSAASQAQQSFAVQSATGPTNAAPPTGIPSTDLGTPVSATASATLSATVTLTAGGAIDVVTAPAGSLPTGTTLSVYPITTTTPLVAELPVGDSYVVALGVSWQAPDGSSPKASVPITLTITDSSIVAGDTVYELTSSGLIEVGIATVNGGVTISFTSDPIFMVAHLIAVTQAALSVTSLSGTLGTALTLAASGGSGGGVTTFSVTNGTATGCAISRSSLTARSAGTCLVTASKAADTTYLAVSSTVAAVALALPARPSTLTLGFAGSSSVLTPAANRALTALAKKLLAGASVTITGYAKGNAGLARSRATAVAKYLLTRVKVHVTEKTVTNAAASKITVATTKQ